MSKLTIEDLQKAHDVYFVDRPQPLEDREAMELWFKTELEMLETFTRVFEKFRKQQEDRDI